MIIYFRDKQGDTGTFLTKIQKIRQKYFFLNVLFLWIIFVCGQNEGIYTLLESMTLQFLMKNNMNGKLKFNK